MLLEQNNQNRTSSVLILVLVYSVYCLSISNYFYFAAYSKLLVIVILSLIILFKLKNYSLPAEYFKKFGIIFLFIIPFALIQFVTNNSIMGDFNLRIGMVFFMIPFSVLLIDDKRYLVIDFISYALPFTCVYALLHSLLNKLPLIVPAGNSNSLAIIVSLGSLATIHQLIYCKVKMGRILYFLSFLLSLYVVYQVHSLGAFLVLFIGGGLILLFHINFFQLLLGKIKYWHMYVIVLFCIILISTVLLILTELLPLNKINNMEFRIQVLEAGWKIAFDHYLFGIGSGKLQGVLPQYWNPDTTILQGAGETVRHIHNEYLNIFIEGGVFTLLAFIHLIAYAVYNGVQVLSKNSAEDKRFIQIILSLFIGLCVQISFSKSLHFPTVALLFFMLMAILIFHPLDKNKMVAGRKPKLLIYFSLIGVFVFITPLISENYRLKTILDDFDKGLVYLKNNQPNIKDKSPKEILNQYRDILIAKKHNQNAKLITGLLNKNKKLSRQEELAVLFYLSDLNFNFEKRLKAISKSSFNLGVKYVAYKEYLQILTTYGKWKQVLKVSEELYQISPATLMVTFCIYECHLKKQEYAMGLNYLNKTYRLVGNPLLLKTIIEHNIRYTSNPVTMKLIIECIELREKIEYDPKYTKYQLLARFGELNQYYRDFVFTLIEKGNHDEANHIFHLWQKNKNGLISKQDTTQLILKFPEILTKIPK